MTLMSFGCAAYDDFHGVVFTVQSLRMYHPIDDCEIIVVDNNPGGPHGADTKNFCEKTNGLARYIPMPESTGTTQPRERIFTEARGEIVLCMDPHVLFATGAIERLLRWYDANPESLDLMSGPLIYDDLQNVVTGFDERWNAEMEGQWFCDPRGINPDAEPFDVPGQGLGVFTCRKKAWLGFNPHFRQFGGEELYIHRKFRAAGRRTMCLPFLRWWHRFGRPEGVRYPIQRYSKVRNYVLGHQELGMDVAPIHKHFVASGLLPSAEWDYLLADPVAHENPENTIAVPGCGSCGSGAPGSYGRPQPPVEATTIKEIFKWSKSVPRDMEQHYDVMHEFASKCQHITEFSKRRETTLVMLTGYPLTMISYNSEKDEIFDRYHAAVKAEGVTETFTTHLFDNDPLSFEPIKPTDLLLIHSIHHGDRLLQELVKHGPQVKRFIMLRSTSAYAEMSEDGQGPGLLPAIRAWVKLHPEWSVVYHSIEQYGLTVLGRLPKDKPKLPSAIKMGWNLAKSLADYAVDGFERTTIENFTARLDTCAICDQRVTDRCAACGCFIEAKAAMAVIECPLGKWDV